MSGPDTTLPRRSFTPGLHPLEEGVILTDGSIVRVTGLFAVRYRTDPDAVRQFIEDDLKRKKGAESHG